MGVKELSLITRSLLRILADGCCLGELTPRDGSGTADQLNLLVAGAAACFRTTFTAPGGMPTTRLNVRLDPGAPRRRR